MKTLTGLPLRQWQKDCLTNLTQKVDEGQTNFTVVAAMASGKTFLQGAFTQELFDKGLIDFVIAVVPSDNLRTNTASQMWEHFGLDISSDLSSREHGLVTTYHMMAREKNVMDLLERTVGQGKRFLLIADEVHHASSDEEAKWGAGLNILVQEASYTLMLSGTLWRSDGSTITGVNYSSITDVVHKVDPDYTYSLADATKDGVIAPVYFTELSADVTYQKSIDDHGLGTEEIEINRTAIQDKVIERAYKHMINTKGEFCKELLEKAHDALEHKCNIHELNNPYDIEPGGLVVATSIEAAESISVLLEEITGEEPVVVHGGRLNSKDLISKFSNGEVPQRWIVSVGMITEGVDIPRIKVLVYLTRSRSQLVFHQIVGRALRSRTIKEDALIYLPSTPRLHGHVDSFMKEQDVYSLNFGKRLKKEKKVSKAKLRVTEDFIQAVPTRIESFNNGVRIMYESLISELKEALDEALALFEVVGEPQ